MMLYKVPYDKQYNKVVALQKVNKIVTKPPEVRLFFKKSLKIR